MGQIAGREEQLVAECGASRWLGQRADKAWKNVLQTDKQIHGLRQKAVDSYL
jgi:hypothetical protein